MAKETKLTREQKKELKILRKNDRRLTKVEKKEEGGTMSLCEQVSELLGNKIFVLTTLGLTGLFFIVTGVQFWITKYLTSLLHTNKDVIIRYFGAVAISGGDSPAVVRLYRRLLHSLSDSLLLILKNLHYRSAHPRRVLRRRSDRPARRLQR